MEFFVMEGKVVFYDLSRKELKSPVVVSKEPGEIYIIHQKLIPNEAIQKIKEKLIGCDREAAEKLYDNAQMDGADVRPCIGVKELCDVIPYPLKEFLPSIVHWLREVA